LPCQNLNFTYQNIRKLKNLLFIILCTLFVQNTIAQEKRLRAYLDSKQFFAPEIGNYLEVYLQFSGTSLKYKGKDSGLIGEVAVRLSVLSNDSIIASDAYRLETPFMKDSIIEDFYDLKRFVLSPGKYTLSIELMDLNSSAAALTAKQPLVIEEFNESITLSDIQIAEIAYKGDSTSVFYKSGLVIIPRLSTFYPSELNTIPLYFEMYNTQLLEDDVCALKQTILSDKGEELVDYTTFTKHTPSQVLPIFKKVDISTLPTGKYTLSYTLLSRSMIELTTQTYEFERSNDIDQTVYNEKIILDPRFQASITDDSVTYYLESLIPISKSTEIKNIISTLKTKNIEDQRKHIQAFWIKTAVANPYDNWLLYKAQVQLVERLYSNNFQEGYETDRGRVYLQFGAPTTIVVKENSPSEYPYEIWQYNKIQAFSNKRFIFYNPDLVNNTYRLLHSDMIGELKNPGWSNVLSKRNTTNGNIDDANQNNEKHYGGNSNDLFRQY